MPKSSNQFELDELRDAVAMFEESPVWAHIQLFLQRIYADSAEEALNHPEDSIKCARASGRAEAIRLITNYKENIPVIKAACGGKTDGDR